MRGKSNKGMTPKYLGTVPQNCGKKLPISVKVTIQTNQPLDICA